MSLALLFFAVSCAVFAFLWRSISRNEQAAQAAESEWQTENSRREEAKSLDASMRAIQNERDQLDTHFASSVDVVPLLDTVEKLASSAGTKTSVTSVDILPNNAGLNVSLKSTGTFQSIYKFLALLENSSYELQFYSVDLESGPLTDVAGKTTGTAWTAAIKVNLVSFE